eukprot:c15015_g1_i1.p1 GENE.c15015_g1_i1~~c15015_g1_i1.p1  ORF type:complete len:215 (-),score=71.15 c15015_g1_i1:87-683(-)
MGSYANNKIIIIGSSAAGKTCLLTRFADNTFAYAEPQTIGIDFKARNIEVDGKKYSVQFWDTAGQDRFRDITASYYRTAKGVILVYDITNRKSFTDLATYWIPAIKQHLTLSDICIFLLGNKADLASERIVSTSEGAELAKSLSCPFLETSALSGENVTEAFLSIGESVVLKFESKPVQNETIQITQNKPQKRSGCSC